MLITFLFILLVVFLYKISFNSEWNDDYLSISRTNAIKGFFILVVFINHINRYIAAHYFSESTFNFLYFKLPAMLGQLMVVMFLFYSGFGVMEQIRSKGIEYVQKMPQKRILTTLINFDVAVLCFIVLNLLLDISMDGLQVILSFFAWDTVGNSNWYIFSILLCYSIAYVICIITKDKIEHISVWIFVTIIFVTIVLSFFKPDIGYNTMMAFGAGCVFSDYKNKIESFFKLHYFRLLICLFILFFLLYIAHYDYRGLLHNVMSIVFAMLVVGITMRVSIGNQILYWLGLNLFPIYIYIKGFQ